MIISTAQNNKDISKSMVPHKKKNLEETLTLRAGHEKQIYLTVELQLKDGDIIRMKRQVTDWEKIYAEDI